MLIHYCDSCSLFYFDAQLSSTLPQDGIGQYPKVRKVVKMLEFADNERKS